MPGGVASRDLEATPRGGAVSEGIVARMSAEPAASSPPAIHEHRRTVTPADIDVLGHVNNLRYLEWTLDAAMEHSEAVGWPWSRYEALGSAWVVRSHAIEYLRPAFLADEVVVRTWVSELARVSSRRKYAIARGDGTVLARAETLWVYVSRRTRAIDRVPPELRGAFTVLADEPASAI